MVNWDKELTASNWKKKRCQLVNPNNDELLADIWIEPTDFTRRSFKVKISKWHAQYPKDERIAEYFLDRIQQGGIGALLSRGDEKYLQCGKKNKREKRRSCKLK